jgi:MFS family permease
MAFGIWAGVSMLGLSLGPLVGGLLVGGLDWRRIFYVNIPFGGAAFLFAWAVIRESRDKSAGQRLDIPGLLTSGLTLFALVFGLVEANKYGWTSWQILLAFVVAWLSFGTS